MEKRSAILALLFLFFLGPEAHAYVGPGAGLSLLGALWALLAAIGTAIVFVVAWPIRRMRRRKRERQEREQASREAPNVKDTDRQAPPVEREDEAGRLQQQ